MKLEELIAQEKIKKLEYPSYKLFLDINDLTKLILEQTGDLDELLDEEKEELMVNMNILDGYDGYNYQAAVALSTALLSIKNLYRNNDIKIRKKGLLNNKDLKGIMPKEYYNELSKGNLGSADLEDMVSIAAEAFLQGIETELSKISPYNKKYSTPQSEESIKDKLENVEKYAHLCAKVGDLLISMDNLEKGFILKGIMEHKLNDYEYMFKKVKEDKSHVLTSNVIKAHAALEDLEFDGNMWPFMNKNGSQIELAIYIANSINDLKYTFDEARLSDGKPFMASTKKSFYAMEHPQEFTEGESTQGLGNLIGELILKDETILGMISFYDIKSPYKELDEQLHALGINWQLAKDVTEILSLHGLSRGLTEDTEKSSKDAKQLQFKFHNQKWMESPAHYKELAKKRNGKNYVTENSYATALKVLVENNINKELKDFTLKYFPKEAAYLSNGISGWIEVSEIKKNGKLKSVTELISDEDLESTLEEVAQQFSKDKYEIRVNENVGVCFLFDSDRGDYAKTNFISTVEVKDDFKHIEKVDKLAALWERTEVLAHEVIHVSQIDSPVKWRGVAVYYVNSVANMAIEEYKKGSLNYQTGGSEITLKKQKKGRRKGTMKEDLIDMLQTETAILLGTSEFAKECRKKGLYDALCNLEEDYEVIKGDEINKKRLLETKLEDSKAAKLVKDTIKAIEEEDIKKLYRLRAKSEEYEEELSTIIETMAEAFGFYCTKDFIENYPRRLSKKKRKSYVESLKNGMIRAGQNAENFIKITKKYQDKPKLKEKYLNKIGLTYKKVLNHEEDARPVTKRLLSLGYDPLNTFEAYDDMVELKIRIEERQKYSEERLEGILTVLGYDESDLYSMITLPEEFIDKLNECNKNAKEKIDSDEIIELMQENDLSLGDFLYPMNMSHAVTGIKYMKHIPTFLKVIDKYGPEEAHKLMLRSQSIKELEKLAE